MDPSVLATAVDLRHAIHAHPELAFQEHNTQKLVKQTLLAAGVPEEHIKPCAGTGLVVDIVGRGPEVDVALHCVAIRADMDCLPMPEANPDLPYRSKREGLAHACGHDGHVSVSTAFALMMHGVADKLPSNQRVRFLFQPAEEDTGGAEPMIAEGCLEGVDEVYGFHNINMLPLGCVWVQPGAASAHCCDFHITIKGAGGHGSSPHLAKDPVIACAAAAVAINTIVSRSVSPFRPAVVSICHMEAGSATNVIPDTALLRGTMRDFDPGVAKLLQERLVEVTKHTAAAHGCEAEIVLDDSYPSIMNHPATTPIITDVCKELLGEDHVVGDVGGGMPGAEDFSYFLQHRPGTFVQVGGFVEGKTVCTVPHQTAYDFEDRIIPIATAMWARTVENRLGVSLFDGDLLPTVPPLPSMGLDGFRKSWT